MVRPGVVDNPKRDGMKTRLFLIIAVTVFAMQGLSFGETGRPAGRLAAAPTKTNPKVEIFVTSWCPYCKEAIEFLQVHRIPFAVYDIEKDKEAAKRKDRLSPNPGVPFAVINGKKIFGFSPHAYAEALNLK